MKAEVVVVAWHVKCPVCFEALEPPGNLLGRIMWVIEDFEVAQELICPKCQSRSTIDERTIHPGGGLGVYPPA